MVIVRGVRRLDPEPPQRVILRGRRMAPYWATRGWMADEDGYLDGHYLAAGRRVAGKVNFRSLRFYIRHPPRELRQHGHWPCFFYRKNGWYEIHFRTQPGDVSSGIMQIERMLYEALERNPTQTTGRNDGERKENARPWWHRLFE